MTQRGPVWFVESMFPGYLFAKFIYSMQHRAVESSHGISGIVHFGDRLATLPENIVTALQSSVGSEEIVTLDCSIKVGQSVEIVDGPFQGLQVVVTHLLSRKSGSASFSIFLGGPWKWNFRRQNCSQRKPDCARYFSAANVTGYHADHLKFSGPPSLSRELGLQIAGLPLRSTFMDEKRADRCSDPGGDACLVSSLSTAGQHQTR